MISTGMFEWLNSFVQLENLSVQQFFVWSKRNIFGPLSIDCSTNKISFCTFMPEFSVHATVSFISLNFGISLSVNCRTISSVNLTTTSSINSSIKSSFDCWRRHFHNETPTNDTFTFEKCPVAHGSSRPGHAFWAVQIGSAISWFSPLFWLRSNTRQCLLSVSHQGPCKLASTPGREGARLPILVISPGLAQEWSEVSRRFSTPQLFTLHSAGRVSDNRTAQAAESIQWNKEERREARRVLPTPHRRGVGRYVVAGRGWKAKPVRHCCFHSDLAAPRRRGDRWLLRGTYSMPMAWKRQSNCSAAWPPGFGSNERVPTH